MIKIIVLITFLIASTAIHADDSPCKNIHIKQGEIEGEYFKTYPSCRYLGLPFAEAPVGKLRFKPTKTPPLPFKTKPFIAKTFSAGCIQNCDLQHPEASCPKTQSEDCLFLNVYTPTTTTSNNKDKDADKLAVLLFIHGGNYIVGAGGVDLYDGSRFASHHNIIVVTINYRLGIFGGLTTSSKIAVGNYNLQDQRAAMKWVKENIDFFGGDANRITIMGQSAGAFSVSSHLASPKSWPYFDSAIVESMPYALPTENQNNTKTAELIGDEVLIQLNCSSIECLQNTSPEDILNVQQNGKLNKIFPIKDYLYKPMPWTPIVSNEKDAELPYTPLEAAMNGKFKKCPIILGTVANESVQFVWGVQPKPMPKIEFDLFVETLFGLKFGEEVLKLYGPPPANETKDTRYFLSILGTDYIFKCPNRYAAKGYSQKVDTYMYRFAHLLSYNTFLQNASVPECDDYVCHGTDLPILFNTEYLTPGKDVPQPTSEEHVLSMQMQTAFSNFAKSGNPNLPITLPTQSGKNTLTWDNYDFNQDNVFKFDTPSSNENNLRKKFCDYFDTIGYYRTG